MQRIEAMKWMQRLALLVVMVWSALFGTPLRAQETAKPANSQPMAWKGTAGDGVPANPQDLERFPGELEAELAKQKLALEVDGSTPELRDGLARLWVVATYREEFPRRWDVLVRIVVVRAEELERRGELAAARIVATDLLPRFEDTKELSRLHPAFAFVPASPELIKGAEAAAADPRLVALRARLEKKLAEQRGLAYIGERAGNAGNPAQDENAAALLESAVARALLEQQPGMIRDLGARAAPALERLVVNDLDTLPPDASLDPLVLLFEVDETRGAQFTLEHWTKGGYLFHKRVLRALEKANVLSNSGTWLAANTRRDVPSFTAPKLLETAWRDVLVLAANDVEVRRDSLDLLLILGEFDAFDAPLQQTLSSWIERGGPSEAAAVLNMLLSCVGRETAVPIAERGLASANGETRALAARILEAYPRSDALRARAQDPEPEVRMAVARSFDGTIVRAAYTIASNDPRLVVPTSMGGGQLEYQRSIDARDSACVEALLGDPDSRVRDLALKAFLQSQAITVSTERLVELAKDADPKVRERLAKWGRKEAMPAEVLRVLAGDTTEKIAKFAADELRRIGYAQVSPDGTEATPSAGMDAYLPAFEALLLNPAILQLSLQEIGWRVGQSAEGVKLLLRVTRAYPTERNFEALLIPLTQRSETFSWESVGVDDLPTLLRETYKPAWRSKWIQLIGVLPERHAAAFRGLLLDTKAAPQVRLLSAAASAVTADAEWNRAFADVVESLPESDLSGDNSSECRMIRDRLKPFDRLETLLLEIAGRRGAPDALGFAFRELARGASCRLPEPLALDVLRREAGRPGGAWINVQSTALASLNCTEAEPRLEILERFISDPWIWSAAANQLSRHHLDAHLPLLERVVLGEFEDKGNNLVHAAAQALAGYLDDRAAGILLKAIAATSDQSRRELFFKALDEIRRYQDERERWANRKSSKAARDAAIAELVPMLGDKDATIRAQAAKSLGALEALEQLPALVRLLKDSNDGVRKAAQSAIDVLTAPKPVPPAPEAPKSDAPAKKDE
ncbi:MAG: HEAT repeat domain-containing protein [Planctomycetota bacterium]|nr:HEAT repeat domain-containing protein [Planctomycetota bacterium]